MGATGTITVKRGYFSDQMGPPWGTWGWAVTTVLEELRATSLSLPLNQDFPHFCGFLISLSRSLPWQDKHLDSHPALTSSVTLGQSLHHPQFWFLAFKMGTLSQPTGLSSRLNEKTDRP